MKQQQLEDRIKELEAERVVDMSDTGQMRDRLARQRDTIVEQTNRIRELEAERDALKEGFYSKSAYCDYLEAERDALREALSEIATTEDANPYADEVCQAIARAALQEKKE